MPPESKLLHMRYGHCHANKIAHLGLATKEQLMSCGEYLTCLLSKPLRKSFPKEAKPSGERTAQIDISKYTISKDGFQYLLLIGIKDTNCIWGYTIKNKSDAKQCIKDWLNTIFQLVPQETRPTCIQTDNAKELDCSDIAAQSGIKYRTTGTYSPQQNGFIERALAEIEKMTLALLIQANFPKEYWTHAARHAITIWNRLPNPKLDWLTPMEITYLQLGYDRKDLRVFGCLAAVQVPQKQHNKLDFERTIGTYIGNSSNSPDLLVLVPGVEKS